MNGPLHPDIYDIAEFLLVLFLVGLGVTALAVVGILIAI